MSQSPPCSAPPIPARSESQSLFNIYYLGNTTVDRRCSSSVMPWIIEEMKIKATKMRFVWLTPGKILVFKCGRFTSTRMNNKIWLCRCLTLCHIIVHRRLKY